MAENNKPVKVTKETAGLDINKDGVIDSKDMRNRITATTPELKELDANGDGFVDAQDLITSGISLLNTEQEGQKEPGVFQQILRSTVGVNPLTASTYWFLNSTSSRQERSAVEEQTNRYQKIEKALKLSTAEANAVRTELGLPSISAGTPGVTPTTTGQSAVDVVPGSEADLRSRYLDADGNFTSVWLGLDNLAMSGNLITETRTFTDEELASMPWLDQNQKTQEVAYVLVGDEKRLVKYKLGDEFRMVQSLSKNLQELFRFRQTAWLSGYYGDAKPNMVGAATARDVEVMRSIMSDSNVTGSDWVDYITPLYEEGAKYGAPLTPEEAAKIQLEQEKTGKAAVEQLNMYAMDNNITLSKDYVFKKQKEILNGTKTLDDVKAEIRDVFLKTYYPSYANDLDRGMTIKELVQPYSEVLSRTLEIPLSDNPMSDNLIKQVLSYKDEKGVPAKMPIWQFEQMVKQDERWQYTDNAYSEIFNKARQAKGMI